MYLIEQATINPVTYHVTVGLVNDYFQFQSVGSIPSVPVALKGPFGRGNRYEEGMG